MLQQLFGAELDFSMRLVIAVVVIAVLLAITVLVMRKLGGRPRRSIGRGEPRLAIVDAIAIDQRRRLVLVRRDDVEHLVLTGGDNDVVVEKNITGVTEGNRRALPAEHEAPLAMPQGAAKPFLAGATPMREARSLPRHASEPLHFEPNRRAAEEPSPLGAAPRPRTQPIPDMSALHRPSQKDRLTALPDAESAEYKPVPEEEASHGADMLADETAAAEKAAVERAAAEKAAAEKAAAEKTAAEKAAVEKAAAERAAAEKAAVEKAAAERAAAEKAAAEKAAVERAAAEKAAAEKAAAERAAAEKAAAEKAAAAERAAAEKAAAEKAAAAERAAAEKAAAEKAAAAERAAAEKAAAEKAAAERAAAEKALEEQIAAEMAAAFSTREVFTPPPQAETSPRPIIWPTSRHDAVRRDIEDTARPTPVETRLQEMAQRLDAALSHSTEDKLHLSLSDLLEDIEGAVAAPPSPPERPQIPLKPRTPLAPPPRIEPTSRIEPPPRVEPASRPVLTMPIRPSRPEAPTPAPRDAAPEGFVAPRPTTRSEPLPSAGWFRALRRTSESAPPADAAKTPEVPASPELSGEVAGARTTEPFLSARRPEPEPVLRPPASKSSTAAKEEPETPETLKDEPAKDDARDFLDDFDAEMANLLGRTPPR